MVYIQLRTQTKDSEAVYTQSKYRLKTWKDYKSLQKTKIDFASLQTLPEDFTRLQRSWQTNPVVPVMDWTEDGELHKRYIEWKEEVELELGSFLSSRANVVKSN